MSKYHTTVLLQLAVDSLQVQPGDTYIDATLGGGGHTFEIAQRGGIVLSIDQDKDAIAYVAGKLPQLHQDVQKRITLVQGNFAQIAAIAQSHGFDHVSGILFDLGVSGHQFEEAQRGFSLAKEGPLDMRMDNSLGVTAADLVNGLTKAELIELFTKYAEEPFAKKIAETIIVGRLEKPFSTTKELADTIAHTVPKIGKVHPATRVFQALRIAVNDELHSLEDALPQAAELLEEKGRLVVISFHSLEDRIVKQAFREFEKEKLGKVITDKPLIPKREEVETNKRARSAKMRIFKRASLGENI